MSDDPYSTHVSVLKGLKPKPKRVLEFGAGLYSTKTFLGMESVTKLVTVEADPEWREKVKAEFGSDKRWTLQGDKEVPPLSDFDLVFVDDGKSAPERIETIRYVLKQAGRPRVVVHDAEVYLPVILYYVDDEQVKVHDKLTPHTAVVR